jgi:hypothetical protein
MSANPEPLQVPEPMLAQSMAVSQPRIVSQKTHWNPTDFAHEQIRGLVRRVFFGGLQPAKQVVFSPVDPATDVAHLCDRVAWALAAETQTHVASVGRAPRITQAIRLHPNSGFTPIKSLSTQLKANLWHVPELRLRELSARELAPRENGLASCAGGDWLSWLVELRNEFEYAVVQGPVANISSEAALMAQLADGIILVLEARSSRKATLRKIKEVLESTPCRILGTVLSERAFPMPERIYRRL